MHSWKTVLELGDAVEKATASLSWLLRVAASAGTESDSADYGSDLNAGLTMLVGQVQHADEAEVHRQVLQTTRCILLRHSRDHVLGKGRTEGQIGISWHLGLK